MFRKIIIKITIKMAISYSYPMGTPKLTDTVLGVQYEEGKDPAVKNFSISDIVNLGGGGGGSIPTLQQVTGEGANTTIQMQINGINVATLNDIPDTPDLQQVVTEGNIVTSGTSQLALTADQLSILNPATSTGTALRRDSLRFTIFGAGKTSNLDLSSNELNSNRVQTFQDADGVIALTSDLSNYVPYTGATQSINIGANDILTSGVSKLSSSGGVYGGDIFLYDFTNEDYGYISLSENEYFLHGAGGGNIIIMSENGIAFDDNLWRSSISTGTITGNRTYTLPDATGTIALSTYKVYTALLTQTGTGSAPIPTPLENTLGGAVTYSYVSNGVYNVNIPSAISTSNIAAFIQTTRPDWQVTIEVQSPTLLRISTSSIDAFPPTPANNRLSNTPIEIRVYN